MAQQIFGNPSLKFNNEIPSGKTVWTSPSNIALIKYWGKKPVQIPMNPSISLTLKKSVTTTSIEFQPANNGFDLTFYFENQRNEVFEDKTKKFFLSLTTLFPFIEQLQFKIHSSNSFPHSAGIASSASGMSALALGLCDIEKTYFNTLDEKSFYQKASYVARLGSGSACRSVYGGVVLWGKDELVPNSSDLYGTPVNQLIHPEFLHFQDTILLVDAGQKKVSSRAGHALMETNPFAQTRFAQARQHLKELMSILKHGDLDRFIQLVELEALTLHAMMMTSSPYYLLLKPNTLAILDKIFQFRDETKTPVCFTLDAGPNVHLLYPENEKQIVRQFIESELKKHINENGLIHDQVGDGPKKIEK
jgi:diphosphomevalonate decarboxylase